MADNKSKWYMKLVPRRIRPASYLRSITSGSFYRLSDALTGSTFTDIQSKIIAMRNLAKDSQVSTALSYYATDATTTNAEGKVIWASPVTKNDEEVADIVNALLDRWKVTSYARSHILELATIGNLYIPTTRWFNEYGGRTSAVNIALDTNTIKDEDFDIVPSYKIPPEDVVHIWQKGEPKGFIVTPEDDVSNYILYPEGSIIHFSLGGLLGEYKISAKNKEGEEEEYDIQFADPLMEDAVQPTQTLGLLENALLLSSLTKVVRFINVDCSGLTDDEIQTALQQLKDTVEQQLAINTSAGQIESFVNPQSPNNLIYLPKVNGQDMISITDMDMQDVTENDSKLLEHYQDKKLSVLGVPKEAMNFSSNEGLGGAGSVLAQRSQIYANGLDRLVTAYKEGWKNAINSYFYAKNMSGMVDRYVLHTQPMPTTLGEVMSTRRDSAIQQATSIIDMLKSIGVKDKETYRQAISEILLDVLPVSSSDSKTWDINLDEEEGGGRF